MTKRKAKSVDKGQEPKFEGPLAEPIKANKLLAVALRYPEEGPEKDEAWKAAWEDVEVQRIAKYRSLAERYGIDWTNDLSALAQIALRLAEECVPGFRLSISRGLPEPSPGPGRKRERDWLPLYFSIEALRAEGLSITEACRQIQKRGEYLNDDHESLIRRHGDVRRRFEKTDRNTKH